MIKPLPSDHAYYLSLSETLPGTDYAAYSKALEEYVTYLTDVVEEAYWEAWDDKKNSYGDDPDLSWLESAAHDSLYGYYNTRKDDRI